MGNFGFLKDACKDVWTDHLSLLKDRRTSEEAVGCDSWP
jgi:hypothetical protein